MYTINFYEQQFQSKENIQPLIDYLITQAILLNYFIKEKSVLISYNLIVYGMSIFKKNKNISVSFFIDKKTNQLKFIVYQFYQNERIVFMKREEQNFKCVFDNIINFL